MREEAQKDKTKKTGRRSAGRGVKQRRKGEKENRERRRLPKRKTNSDMQTAECRLSTDMQASRWARQTARSAERQESITGTTERRKKKDEKRKEKDPMARSGGFFVFSFPPLRCNNASCILASEERFTTKVRKSSWAVEAVHWQSMAAVPCFNSF